VVDQRAVAGNTAELLLFSLVTNARLRNFWGRLFWEGNGRPRGNRNDRNNADSVTVITADLGRVIVAVASAASTHG